MPDDPRVQQLLDELLDSQATPEEVCRSCPELLPRVRERWREIRRAQAELDAQFPPMTERDPKPAASPSLDIRLPLIPGYEVEALLGRGGMGVVFRARHLRLNRVIALKMALAGAYAGPQERERFQREAEAVAGLCHANIIQLHEVGDHEGRPYFTMEFVDGGSLAQKLAQRRDEGAGMREEGRSDPSSSLIPSPSSHSSSSHIPPPPSLPEVNWAAELVATLAEAVSVAHRAGIVHRDLKPGNILLTAEGTPKISDFGLARRLKGKSDLTGTGAVVGTPSYMAPEQASDKAGPVGPATDFYGLGAILYEILTGRPPFRGESALATLRQVLSEEPVAPSRLNPRVPRDLETICLKCLRKEPQRRYTSAAALAEDLRRYLLGQVVEARPVGPLERAGKWIRRNQWVASLSGAAVFALVAGTMVSLLFALEARRQEGLATDRAGELERQADELKVQTRAATDNAQRAKEQEEEVRRVLIASLMMPIEGNAHPLNSRLDNTEVVGLCQLRKVPKEIRLQFLDTALRDPETARRVGRRADWVIQAIIGCDRVLRDEAGQLLIQHVQKQETEREVMVACARLGQAANLGDRKWAERSADALSGALCDKGFDRDDCPVLAESLASVIEYLPRAQAAGHAARVTDVFLARLQEPIGRFIAYTNFARVIEVMSPHLDAAALNRTAETIGDIIRRSDSNPYPWPVLARTLVTISQRLPKSESTAQVSGLVDIVLETRSATNEKDKFRYVVYSETLGALAGQFDAKAAARAADAIVATLGDFYMTGPIRTDFIENASILQDLAKVAEHLDAPASLRAALALIPLLNKAAKLWNPEPLRKALVGVCRRLDADGARRVADAITLAVKDPETPILVRIVLADGFVVLSGKLEPDKAASVESAIVDWLLLDLADKTPIVARMQLGPALAAVCGRPGTKSATRAALALTAAIRDPQAPLGLLKSDTAALAAVLDQLPPTQAASHATKAAEALGSRWIAKMNHLDLASLALAMAELWKCLGSRGAAAHAKRMAADLGDALQDLKAETHELKSLAEALAAVCSQLDPAEREPRLNRAVDILLARFRKPKSADQPSALLTGPLLTLWLHLDRNGLARAADTLFTDLGDPVGQRYWFEYAEHLDLLKKVAARMDERDLERLLEQPLTARTVQRALLDVLGQSKNRYFRNTWDYLDSAGF
jgi:serine/threonine protein kinase